MVLDDLDGAIEKMNMRHELSVYFSMDQLKIDQSFVFNIGIKASDAVIVQTIIGNAKNLYIEVIAEGMETEQHREFLELNGCSNYQGYLFSKPVPIEQFEMYF